MEYEVNSHLRKTGQWPVTSRYGAPAVPTQHSDFLIVGAGAFGASTAYHLAKAIPTAIITIIDRTPFPPRHAASTDINKIVRADYSSAFYMDLAYEAMQAWETWPELKPLYHRTGWVNFSQRGSDLAERIRKNFRDRGADPTGDIDLQDVRGRFGGVFRDTDLEKVDGAYWNPEAGWCDAAAAVAVILEQTLKNPNLRYVVADVEKIIKRGSQGVQGVLARSGEIFTANKVLLATGAWTSSLMTTLEDELSIEEEGRTEAQIKAAGVCVTHFRISDKEMEELKYMPVVIYGEGGDGQLPPARSQLLKFTNAASFTNTVTTASGHKVSVPPEHDQYTVPEYLKEETLAVIASKVMPKYTARAVESWRLCWDAVSPSQDLLITRHPHPGLSNLYFAAGGSFHSWKFLPIIGKYIVKVLQDMSNGSEKDSRWAWKTEEFSGRGAHEKAYPTRELRGLERDAGETSKL